MLDVFVLPALLSFMPGVFLLAVVFFTAGIFVAFSDRVYAAVGSGWDRDTVNVGDAAMLCVLLRRCVLTGRICNAMREYHAAAYGA